MSPRINLSLTASLEPKTEGAGETKAQAMLDPECGDKVTISYFRIITVTTGHWGGWHQRAHQPFSHEQQSLWFNSPPISPSFCLSSPPLLPSSLSQIALLCLSAYSYRTWLSTKAKQWVVHSRTQAQHKGVNKVIYRGLFFLKILNALHFLHRAMTVVVWCVRSGENQREVCLVRWPSQCDAIGEGSWLCVITEWSRGTLSYYVLMLLVGCEPGSPAREPNDVLTVKT